MKNNFFNLKMLTLLCLFVSFAVEARRCQRGSTAAGFFAGALTGAALAGAYDHSPYYHQAGYPGPLYGYDYPAYVYSPLYAYPRTSYTYPGYYYFGY